LVSIKQKSRQLPAFLFYANQLNGPY